MTRRPGLLALVAVAACGGGGADGASTGQEASAQPVVHAEVAAAETQAIPLVVRAIGTVVPRPGSYAQLGPPAATRVTRVYVTEGECVAEGDSLVGFERASFEAGAQSAEAAVTSARRAYERAVRLSAAGILPRKDVDQAAADLAQASATEVNARRARQLATLRAPVAGVVARMSAVLGAPVDANQPVVSVVDPDSLDVLLTLPPAQAARVEPGAQVTLIAGQAEEEPLGEGVVSAVAAAVDSASGAVTVRVRVGSPVRPLKLGESVFGRVTLDVHAGAIVVPLQALVPTGDSLQVFVVDSAGVAHARPVAVGIRTETSAEIVRGVERGENVVTSAAYGLVEGTRVRSTER